MASRGSRRLTVFVVVLVVLAGLAVAADRIGVKVAEHIAASKIKSAQHLSSTPSVDIDGFPFLTQLARSDFDKITVDADGVPIGKDAHGATLDHLHVVLSGVHVSDSFHHIRADSLTASGDTSLNQLATAIGIGTLSYPGGGRIALRESATVLGQKLTATVSSKPEVRDGELVFTGIRIDDAGSLLASVSKAFSAVFDIAIPLDAVPFHLRATSIDVTPQGVSFALTGRDVDLTST